MINKFLCLLLSWLLILHLHSQSYFENGKHQYLNGDYKSAFDLFTKAIDTEDILRSKSYMFRGATRLFLGQIAEAKGDLDVSYSLDSADAKLFYYYGKYFLFRGEYDSCILFSVKSLKYDSTDADVYDQRAVAKSLNGDLQGAYDDENIAIRLNKSKEFFYSNRAYISISLKKYDEAIEDLNTSLSIKPSQKAYANKGLALSLKGLHKEAIESYTQSLEMNPNDGEVYYYRGNSFKEMGKIDNACSDFRKSISLGYVLALDILKIGGCQ